MIPNLFFSHDPPLKFLKALWHIILIIQKVTFWREGINLALNKPSKERDIRERKKIRKLNFRLKKCKEFTINNSLPPLKNQIALWRF